MNRQEENSDAGQDQIHGSVIEEGSGSNRRGLGNTFASLAYRDFVYLWLGQISHAFALWLDQIAKPLLILQLTGSPIHLGLILAARTAPAVGFGLIAGVIADNFNRRFVLLATKWVVLVLSAIFAVIVVLGWVELWHIYAYNILRGATMAFDQPARRAMMPQFQQAPAIPRPSSV